MTDETVDEEAPENAARAPAEPDETPGSGMNEEAPASAESADSAESAESAADEAESGAGADTAPAETASAGAGESAEGAAPPATESDAVDAPAESPGGEGARFDKLEKAEEILRSSAPESPREAIEDAYEKVVHINRCAKVVKGGRRFSFSALVVSGDREGHVGYGLGKAQEVAECIKKASEASKKSMVAVNITRNTIPHPVVGEHGGGRVLLRPASPGTGVIAGGGVRAVVEAAGIHDVLAKSLGSNNHANVVKATLNALEQLRTKEQIYSLRGKRMPERKAL